MKEEQSQNLHRTTDLKEGEVDEAHKSNGASGRNGPKP
jgi:hypothetical protein